MAHEQSTVIDNVLDHTSPKPPVDINHPGKLAALTAERLFMDGLQLIFTYLNTCEWVTVQAVCRHWNKAGETDPYKQLDWIIPDSHNKTAKLTEFLRMVKKCEKRRLKQRRWNYQRITRLEIVAPQQIATLMEFFKYLPEMHKINIRLAYEKQEFPRIQPIPNSSHLRTLELNFQGLLRPNLIRSFLESCCSCTSIQLLGLSPDQDWCAFEPLARLNQLHELRLGTHWYANGKLSQLPVNFELPQSLTSVRIDSQCEWLLPFTAGEMQVRQYLPNLHHIICYDSILDRDKLEQLALTVPNLVELIPAQFIFEPGMSTFSLFRSLHAIEFRSPPRSPGVEPLTDHQLMNILACCPSLTTLGFCYSLSAEEAPSWARSGSPDMLPQLSHLGFWYGNAIGTA